MVWAYMGPPGQAARAAGGRVVRAAREPRVRFQAAAGMQLSAGDGGRHRHQPRRRTCTATKWTDDPMHQGTQGQRVHQGRRQRGVRRSRSTAFGLTLYGRRNGEPDSYYWRDHAVAVPVVHADSAVRRSCARRPRLGADRRPPLLGLEHQLPSATSRCTADGAAAHGGRQGHPLASTSRGTFRPAGEQATTTTSSTAARRRSGAPTAACSGFSVQDASLQESMGPIQDHAKEKLLPTDRAIVMARRLLYDATLALPKGVEPPALDAAAARARRRLLLDRQAKTAGMGQGAPDRRPRSTSLYPLSRSTRMDRVKR